MAQAVGYRRRVELWAQDVNCAGGTLWSELIGYTPSHREAPNGNAVETWRAGQLILHVIHGGNEKSANLALAFWLVDGRWRFMWMNRSLENSYANDSTKSHQHVREAERAFDSAIVVLERHVSASLLTP